jgi:cytoskeletal protein CcmA (bactofilin family)
MFPARALVYAIVVSLFVALISAAFIQLAEMNRTLQTDQIEQERLVRNLNSGITLLLNTEGYDISKTLDLYGNEEDSISISKKPWGFFCIGSVMAFGRNSFLEDTLQKTCLLGSSNNKTLPTALYLSDFNTPLSLTGNALIMGDAILPKSGVKSISIAGVSYLRSQLVYGKQALSTSTLPELDNSLFNKFAKNDSSKGIVIKSIPKSLIQPFNAPTLTLQADSMYLNNCELKGNIHIKSNGTVTIGSNCDIEDVIVTASKIIIKSGFKGSLQAYAQDELILEQSTTLLYPSTVGILRGYQSKKQAILIVNRGCVIDGALIALQESGNTYPLWVGLQESSLVRGQVYVRGSLELKGSVYGNVTADKFSLRAGGGLYDNIIMDGMIDRSKLSRFYVGPFLMKDGEKVGVAKWF